MAGGTSGTVPFLAELEVSKQVNASVDADRAEKHEFVSEHVPTHVWRARPHEIGCVEREQITRAIAHTRAVAVAAAEADAAYVWDPSKGKRCKARLRRGPAQRANRGPRCKQPSRGDTGLCARCSGLGRSAEC